jgi:hypothetical protein
LIILDTAAVDTPARLATSANATPWFFTNPIAINARTPETSLRRLPDLNSLIDTFSFLHENVEQLIRTPAMSALIAVHQKERGQIFLFGGS